MSVYPSWLIGFGIPLFEEINIYKPKNKIQTIEIPKLFVHGLADETVSYKVSLEVHNKCTNSKLELIENGSHTFDTDKQALKDAVDKTVEFIKEIF